MVSTAGVDLLITLRLTSIRSTVLEAACEVLTKRGADGGRIAKSFLQMMAKLGLTSLSLWQYAVVKALEDTIVQGQNVPP